MTYLTGFHAIEERIKSDRPCGPLLVAKAGPRAREITKLAVNKKIRLERTIASLSKRLEEVERELDNN